METREKHTVVFYSPGTFPFGDGDVLLDREGNDVTPPPAGQAQQSGEVSP